MVVDLPGFDTDKTVLSLPKPRDLTSSPIITPPCAI